MTFDEIKILRSALVIVGKLLDEAELKVLQNKIKVKRNELGIDAGGDGLEKDSGE